MRTLLAPLLLGLIGLGLYQGRLCFIRDWFQPGAVTSATAPEPASPPAAATTASARQPVRVVLLDGLDLLAARRLPGLSAVCRAGVTLHLDAGFPAVSLTAQHVLWTGARPHHSGVLFPRAGLKRPVFDSLPAALRRRGGEALAVVEDHPEIAASFPFSRIVEPPAPAFTRALLDAAHTAADLVFIHLLGPDRAGHWYGASSPEYRDAARRADDLLASLWRSRDPRWTLLALSDHGHLPLGGHGDTEPRVRWTRACLAGPGLPAGRIASATLPDLNRFLTDRLALPRLSAAEGRSLTEVLRAAACNGPPDGDPLATSPPMAAPLAAPAMAPWRLALPGLLLALALLLLVLATLRRAARPRGLPLLLALPWSLALALLFLTAGRGAPSLSQPYVYPALPLPLLGASLPVLLFLGLQLWTLRHLGVPQRAALVLLAALLLLPALIPLALTGWPWLRPPLFPGLTGWASTLLFLTAAGSLALGGWWIALCLLDASAGSAQRRRRASRSMVIRR